MGLIRRSPTSIRQVDFLLNYWVDNWLNIYVRIADTFGIEVRFQILKFWVCRKSLKFIFALYKMHEMGNSKMSFALKIAHRRMKRMER